VQTQCLLSLVYQGQASEIIAIYLACLALSHASPSKSYIIRIGVRKHNMEGSFCLLREDRTHMIADSGVLSESLQ